MSKTKIGVFGALMFGVMMLLIPATSIASAQEYDKYYKEKDRYGKDYGYGYDNDRPVIIIKNQFSEPHKDKKMKEPPMVLVNKEVLFCDVVANGTEDDCDNPVPEPNSDRWVQECTSEQCQGINPSTFDIAVTNTNLFEASEQSTKVNLDIRNFVVSEPSPVPTGPGFEFDCFEAGFDGVVVDFRDDGSNLQFASCVLFEGECSGTVQHGEQKECTVKNYVFAVESL
ncbi:MAG: hypothetical protein ACPKPY_01785 [Nitrososphaeraceae archaeon]